VIRAQRTALAVRASGPPLAVQASDGREQIEYDLLITNAIDSPVTLRSLEVLDGRGRRLLRLRGEALANATHELLRSPPAATVPASGTVATMLDVVAPERHRPTHLTQRIRYDVPPDAPSRNEIGSLVVRGPSLRISRRAPVVIAPPLSGGGWLGINAACCEPSGHREALFPANGRFVKPETFAIDWLRLRDRRLYAGDGSETRKWFGEGAALLAVADGTVVRAVDGRSEIRPAPFGKPNLHRPDQFDGNYVVIRIRPGAFAFHAHMRPGTVDVHVGQRVRTGQRLGELGNTGQTTAPHLHFSIQDGPDPGSSNSVPFEIDRYRAVGSGRLVPVGTNGAVAARVPITAIPGTARAPRRTYPLNGVLARFRDAR
jgi:Peptidase family M23